MSSAQDRARAIAESAAHSVASGMVKALGTEGGVEEIAGPLVGPLTGFFVYHARSEVLRALEEVQRMCSDGRELATRPGDDEMREISDTFEDSLRALAAKHKEQETTDARTDQ